MNKNLEIAFLSTSMGLGGADQQILTLSDELIARGHNIHIISLRPIGPMGKAAREVGAKVSSLNIERKFRSPLYLPKLRRLVGNVDILHTHMFHPNIISRVCEPFLNFDVLVNTIHNVFESDKSYQNPNKKTLRNYAQQYTKNKCDFISCVSREAYDRFIDIGAITPKQAGVVYNGIDTKNFYSKTSMRKNTRNEHDVSDKFIWLSIGRFFEQKDHRTLLRAFAMMEHDDACLWLVGHGELRPRLESLVGELSLQDQVEFLGTVEDVTDYMAAADGFTLSPKWEGFGIVFAEAQASGLPVVSTNVGGVPEVVENGESGILVPPESPDELSAALDRVTGMPQASRRKMGKKGRAKVNKNFSSSAIADEWEQHYYRLVNS